MFGGRRTRVLWLIRCGENEWDAEDRLRGDEDLPLTLAGEAATREAVERASSLPFPRPSVIHHPLDQSAVSTAKLAATALGSRLRGNDELADPSLGVLAGITLGGTPRSIRATSTAMGRGPVDLDATGWRALSGRSSSTHRGGTDDSASQSNRGRGDRGSRSRGRVSCGPRWRVSRRAIRGVGWKVGRGSRPGRFPRMSRNGSIMCLKPSGPARETERNPPNFSRWLVSSHGIG